MTGNDMISHFTEWIENERRNISICDRIDFNKQQNMVQIEIEVMGTQFNGRTELIEFLQVGDKLQIVRDADNYFDQFTLSVCNEKGEELGTMWVNLADELSPLLDAGLARIIDSHVKQVVPLSKREQGTVKAILQMEMTILLIPSKEREIVPEETLDFTQPVENEIPVHMPDSDLKQKQDIAPDFIAQPPISQVEPPRSLVKEEKVETAGQAAVTPTLHTTTNELFSVKEIPPVKENIVLPVELPQVPEKKRKKGSKAWIAVLVIGIIMWITVIGGGIYYVTEFYIPAKHYEKGYELYQEEKYQLAVDELELAGDYMDAKNLLKNCYEKMMETEEEE